MKLSDIDFGHEHYRGYDIRVNALENGIYIERGGIWVVDVPAASSWRYARNFIDLLCNPNNYWWEGTSTGIAMRATDKRRCDSLIAMAQGDRRDALVMDAMRKLQFSDGSWYFDYEERTAITDPYSDESGGTTVDPLEYYGLTKFEADLLVNLNEGPVN